MNATFKRNMGLYYKTSFVVWGNNVEYKYHLVTLYVLPLVCAHIPRWSPQTNANQFLLCAYLINAPLYPYT